MPLKEMDAKTLTNMTELKYAGLQHETGQSYLTVLTIAMRVLYVIEDLLALLPKGLLTAELKVSSS